MQNLYDGSIIRAKYNAYGPNEAQYIAYHPVVPEGNTGACRVPASLAYFIYTSKPVSEGYANAVPNSSLFLLSG